jgi:hypothetical protein
MQFDLQTLVQPVDLTSLDSPFSIEEIDVVVKELPLDKSPLSDGFNGMFIKRCWNIIKADFYNLIDAFCVVKELPLNKSPVSDGFNGIFIKRCWNITEADFYNMIDAFYIGLADLQCLNSSYITLVPKNQNPTSINDFSPISLLGGPIKLIPKLLANRLQKVITQIVHTNQYGFIKQRTILDYLAWAFQYLHLCHSSKKEIVILKLDFKKAFDKVERHVILSMLQQKGFSPKWLQWLSNLLSLGTSHVLINGVPGKRIICKRGGGGGLPPPLVSLSPLLFVLQIYSRALLMKPFIES